MTYSPAPAAIAVFIALCARPAAAAWNTLKHDSAQKSLSLIDTEDITSKLSTAYLLHAFETNNTGIGL